MGKVMLVVSDTSAVTSLLQVGQGSLLAALFERVLVPPAVRDELLRFHTLLPDYLEVRTIQDQLAAKTLSHGIDRGEAEAIVLPEECHADYLLMDDRRGRSTAEARGLRVVGLLGVLLRAKRERQIDSVGEVIAELQSQAGFFVTEAVKQIVLTAAGEVP
jgi:predicted nucleic acid-binding protein